MNEKFKANNPPEQEEIIDEEILFGQFLKDARQRIGKIRMSVAEVAAKLDKSHPSKITNWESGSFPDESKLSEIAKAYNVDEEELKRLYNISKRAREKYADRRRKVQGISTTSTPRSSLSNSSSGRRSYPKKGLDL